MSTRHIVRIAPLHTSILLTLVYCFIALAIALTGTFAAWVRDEASLLEFFEQIDVANVLTGIFLNVVLVFIGALLVSFTYNFLAKYFGGFEITLDDD